MNDKRNILQNMFLPSNRFTNYGNILMRLRVTGFRCHDNTIIDIENPITAFSGINGAGKSTILQLAASAYAPSLEKGKKYYLSNFFIVGTLDPKPFNENASVEYNYLDAGVRPKIVTLTRNDNTKRWRGYARRPTRDVFFAGVGLYIPQTEQRDFFFRNAEKICVQDTCQVDSRIKEWTCKILGYSYDNISSNIVECFKREGQIMTVQRSGTSYSEAHMGYGEGRIQYLINALEILPEKSLVLIEEPETSLHPSAQHELGRYFVDVACHKKHQIMITTHSEYILEALPSQSRIYIKKDSDGTTTIPGLTALQAKSLMAAGHTKALFVLVEDKYAKAVLSEMLRRIDPDFLVSISINPVGDKDIIGKTARTLKSTGLPVVAVRDADKDDQPSDNIFKLPGTLPPEKEMFNNEQVKKFLSEFYKINFDDYSTSLSGVDHHYWFERLSNSLNLEEDVLVNEAARIYAHNIREEECVTLAKLLKEATRK